MAEKLVVSQKARALLENMAVAGDHGFQVSSGILNLLSGCSWTYGQDNQVLETLSKIKEEIEKLQNKGEWVLLTEKEYNRVHKRGIIDGDCNLSLAKEVNKNIGFIFATITER